MRGVGSANGEFALTRTIRLYFFPLWFNMKLDVRALETREKGKNKDQGRKGKESYILSE